jgi:hypothetical protein
MRGPERSRRARHLSRFLDAVVGPRPIALPIYKILLQLQFGSFRYRIICYIKNKEQKTSLTLVKQNGGTADVYRKSSSIPDDAAPPPGKEPPAIHAQSHRHRSWDGRHKLLGSHSRQTPAHFSGQLRSQQRYHELNKLSNLKSKIEDDLTLPDLKVRGFSRHFCQNIPIARVPRLTTFALKSA